MSVTLPGDQNFENRPSIEAKALKINLNHHIYGTFAEIGAGQEVARHFFRVGGASGTIAKTISAYDKNFSDTIYGEEEDGRYVTETRLKKMLDHEMKLLEDRIPKTPLLRLILRKSLRVMDGWGLDFKLPRKNPTVKLCFMFDFIKQKQDFSRKPWG